MSEFPPHRILRNLPGVAEIEALLVKAKAHPSFKWSDYWIEAQKQASQVGKRLFGLSAEDTEWTEDDLEEEGLSRPAWEAMIRDNDPADLGWDISDGKGGTLLAVDLLRRQLVLVGLDEDGHEFGEEPTEEEIEADAEDAAEKLKAEVETWRRRPKPR